MVGNQPPVEIVICMGSSCFSRGNSKNLGLIQDYLQANGLEASVKLVGHLCQGLCKEGPNLTVNGQIHHRVDSTAVSSILDGYFQKV
jgi:NADH:ubiquinone oxidoreductase subunit E